MRLPTKRVGKLWTGFAKIARRFPRSPWMSVVAALAVVLGTAGTYVSGQIQTDTQSCTVRRELLLANGSRELTPLRAALLKSAEARTYLTLALAPQAVEQRREYAFLGVTAANNAIMSLPGEAASRIELFKFPTERELTSVRHMVGLADRANRLDVRQLVETFRVHDQAFGEQLKELRECDQRADLGEEIGGIALLLTILSLVLIAIREWHQRHPARSRR
jgi:hypothetical protein